MKKTHFAKTRAAAKRKANAELRRSGYQQTDFGTWVKPGAWLNVQEFCVTHRVDNGTHSAFLFDISTLPSDQSERVRRTCKNR